MQLRTMSEQDIPAGMRLKEIAGWNQTANDWKCFLKASPAGCFVAEVDGTVRGTAATISYEHRFAWVGMVLVDPEFRGQGIGTRLLEKTIAYYSRIRNFTAYSEAPAEDTRRSGCFGVGISRQQEIAGNRRRR
jgi:GNAT superfamily N-acetyltransferase